MKAADVWREAAELAETWAAIGRARAGHMADAWEEDVTIRACDNLDALARAFRVIGAADRREVDFDDQPTPPRDPTVPSGMVTGLLLGGEWDDGVTELDVVLDDDPTWPG